jgi:hypothetical protein
MAVVTKSAAGLPDLTAAKPGSVDVRKNHGVLRTSSFTAVIASGDSPASTFEVARLPSHARISRLSKLHSSGITGATDNDLGPADNPDAFVDGQTLAATATVEGASAITNALSDNAVWELAGMDKDPKSEIPIFLTLKAAATAAGTVVVDLVYIVD